jgi:hypothetical protein|nr:MAG TPA: MqsA [Caudoviricetes sp.]
MKKKAWKPKQKRSDAPTLTGTPPMGYLNSCYCPKCGRHLFSYYDADVSSDRKDGYRFRIAGNWNYCSECGTLLDLDEWKERQETAADEEIQWEE